MQDEAQIRDIIEYRCCSAVAALVTLEALRSVDCGCHQKKADALVSWLRTSLPQDEFHLAALWTAKREGAPPPHPHVTAHPSSFGPFFVCHVCGRSHYVPPPGEAFHARLWIRLHIPAIHAMVIMHTQHALMCAVCALPRDSVEEPDAEGDDSPGAVLDNARPMGGDRLMHLEDAVAVPRHFHGAAANGSAFRDVANTMHDDGELSLPPQQAADGEAPYTPRGRSGRGRGRGRSRGSTGGAARGAGRGGRGVRAKDSRRGLPKSCADLPPPMPTRQRSRQLEDEPAAVDAEAVKAPGPMPTRQRSRQQAETLAADAAEADGPGDEVPAPMATRQRSRQLADACAGDACMAAQLPPPMPTRQRSRQAADAPPVSTAGTLFSFQFLSHRNPGIMDVMMQAPVPYSNAHLLCFQPGFLAHLRASGCMHESYLCPACTSGI